MVVKSVRKRLSQLNPCGFACETMKHHSLWTTCETLNHIEKKPPALSAFGYYYFGKFPHPILKLVISISQIEKWLASQVPTNNFPDADRLLDIKLMELNFCKTCCTVPYFLNLKMCSMVWTRSQWLFLSCLFAHVVCRPKQFFIFGWGEIVQFFGFESFPFQ